MAERRVRSRCPTDRRHSCANVDLAAHQCPPSGGKSEPDQVAASWAVGVDKEGQWHVVSFGLKRTESIPTTQHCLQLTPTRLIKIAHFSKRATADQKGQHPNPDFTGFAYRID